MSSETPQLQPLEVHSTGEEEVKSTTELVKIGNALEAIEDNNRRFVESRDSQKDVWDWLSQHEYLNELKSQIDHTGAMVPELMHYRLGEMMRERGIEFTKEGLVKPNPEDSKHYWVRVTNVDLPWANSQGGSDAGTRNLLETVHAVENGIASIGLTTEEYRVYRIRGADYAAEIDLRKTANLKGARTLADFQKGLHSHKLPNVPKTEHSSPLISAEVSLEEAIGLFNSLQMARASTGVENMILSEREAQKEVVAISKALLTYELEMRKTIYIINYVIQMARGGINEAGVNPDVYFYDFVANYVSKNPNFRELPNLTYEIFKEFVADPKKAQELVETQARVAGRSAMSAEMSLSDSRVDAIIRSHIENKEARGFVSEDELNSLAEEKPADVPPVSAQIKEVFDRISRELTFQKSIAELVEEGREREISPRSQPSKSEHRQELDTLVETFDLASKGLQNLDIVRQEKQPEGATKFDEEQFVTAIRNLLNISNLDHENLLKAVETVTDPDLRKRMQTILGEMDLGNQVREILKISALEWTNEQESIVRNFLYLTERRVNTFRGRHDTLTGLPNNYEYMKNSNRAVLAALEHVEDPTNLSETLSPGNEATTMFIDLGYVNYFNKRGNRETGDEAICQAIIQLEDTLEKQFDFLVDTGESWRNYITIHRYGGDEITLVVTGGERNAELVRWAIGNLSDGKKIQLVGEALGFYVPEQIQYNYADCNINEGRRILDTLIRNGRLYNTEEMARLGYVSTEQGILSTSQARELGFHDSAATFSKEFYATALAKTMTIAADRYSSYKKTYERFIMLWQRYTEARETGVDTRTREHFNDMLDFSAKALRGANIHVFERCEEILDEMMAHPNDRHKMGNPVWEAYVQAISEFHQQRNSRISLPSEQTVEFKDLEMLTTLLVEELSQKEQISTIV